MAILILVSRSMSETAPKIMAVDTAIPNDPALGSRHITATAITAPMKRYGIRLPKRVQVLSLKAPIMG